MIRKLGALFVVLTLCMGLTYGQAEAQISVAPGGIGDLLMFPLYDVRPVDTERTEKWQNYFTIQNTSGQWTAVHLRFRSWKTCIEVWDHPILLSPYDVFWMSLELETEGPNAGNVKMWSADTETLLNSALLHGDEKIFTDYFSLQHNLVQYCGYPTEGDTIQTEMQAGFVEVIGLWQLSLGATIEEARANTEDEAGVNHNILRIVSNVYTEVGNESSINVYDILNALYYSNGNVNPLPRPIPADFPASVTGSELPTGAATRWAVDCRNVVTGAFVMGDTGNGRFEIENYVALMNFRTTNTTGTQIHRDNIAGGEILFPVDALLIKAYNDINSYYINEDWATTIGPTLRDGDDLYDSGMINSTTTASIHVNNDEWSLDDVESVLYKSQIWSNYWNDAYDTQSDTDIVITFPTKHHHFFYRDWPLYNQGGQEQYKAANSYRNSPSIASKFAALPYKGRILANGTVVWDMNQNHSITEDPGEDPGPSPGVFVPEEDLNLFYEVNILRVDATSEEIARFTNVNKGHEILGIPYSGFDWGQLRIPSGAFLMHDGQRYANGYNIPPIGVSINQHKVGSQDDECFVFRSNMKEWNYK